jgi:hypothetical protein
MFWVTLIIVFIKLTVNSQISKRNLVENNIRLTKEKENSSQNANDEELMFSNYVEMKINLFNNSNITYDHDLTNSSSNGIFIDNSKLIPTILKNYTFKISLYDEIYYMRSLTTLEILSSKIKYFKNITDFQSFLKEENDSIKMTILLLEDVNLLRDIQSLFYMSHGRWRKRAINNTAYSAIIFNNSTTALNLILQDLNHPVLEANNLTFHEIKKFAQDDSYDKESSFQNLFSVEKIQTEILIKYDNTQILLPFEYIFSSSYLNIFLISIVVIFWNINTFYLNKRNSTIIQKILTLVLTIKFFVIFLLYIYLKTVTQYNLEEDKILFTKVYLETAVTILSSIYRTILTYLVILLSHGWKIYLAKLGRGEIKTFVMIYLAIYISICADQMFDVIFNKWGQVINFFIKLFYNFLVPSF